MAATGQRHAIDLADTLRDRPQQFHFFQSVRLLELMEGHSITHSSRESRWRFRTPPDLAFPASEVCEVRDNPLPETPANEEAGPSLMEMEVAFFGLTGPSGILPRCYTEFVQERENHKDGAAHAFFDLFTHRALCLFYEAWKKSRFHIAEERGEPRRLARYLLCFAGLDPEAPPCSPNEKGEEKKQEDLQTLCAHFAGGFARQPLTASLIPALLSRYFGVPVTLEQFVGQWLPLPHHEQSAMGKTGCALGQDTFMGGRVWDQQTKVRLRMGPMTRPQFTSLLPGSAGAHQLASLINRCLGETVACDVSLVLEPNQRPPAQLGQALLGLNAWLPQSADDPTLGENVCYCVQP